MCCSRHRARSSQGTGCPPTLRANVAAELRREGKRLQQGADCAGSLRTRALTHRAALNPITPARPALCLGPATQGHLGWPGGPAVTTGSSPGGGRPAPENWPTQLPLPGVTDRGQRPRASRANPRDANSTGEGRGGVTMCGRMAWKDQRLAELPPNFPGVLERPRARGKGGDAFPTLQAPLWLL